MVGSIVKINIVNPWRDLYEFDWDVFMTWQRFQNGCFTNDHRHHGMVVSKRIIASSWYLPWNHSMIISTSMTTMTSISWISHYFVIMSSIISQIHCHHLHVMISELTRTELFFENELISGSMFRVLFWKSAEKHQMSESPLLSNDNFQEITLGRYSQKEQLA